MTKKTIAVLGATGQVGTPLAYTLLEEGHQVVALSRGRNQRNEAKLANLEKRGAQLAFCPDFSDIKAMPTCLKGCDTVVASVQAEKAFLLEVQPQILEAAKSAGVQRFIPNEFGAHTQNLELGSGDIFDYKKQFQDQLFESGLEWTLFYASSVKSVGHLRLRQLTQCVI